MSARAVGNKLSNAGQIELAFEQDGFPTHPQNTSTFHISGYAFICQGLTAGDPSYVAHYMTTLMCARGVGFNLRFSSPIFFSLRFLGRL